MKKYIKPQAGTSGLTTDTILAASLPSNPDGPQIKSSRYCNKLWDDEEDWNF